MTTHALQMLTTQPNKETHCKNSQHNQTKKRAANQLFIWLCCEHLQCVSLFGCVVSICSAFLYLVVLWAFAVRFFIWLCCEHLQCVSLFGCVVSICSVFLYLVVLWAFAVRFFIWLCCEHLQCVSLFGCVVSICSTCCETDEDVFLICWCFFYLHVFSEVAARWALSATVHSCMNYVYLQLHLNYFSHCHYGYGCYSRPSYEYKTGLTLLIHS